MTFAEYRHSESLKSIERAAKLANQGCLSAAIALAYYAGMQEAQAQQEEQKEETARR